MAETMAEQLAAAHAQIERLSATLEERDHTISQLQRENQALSETVAALQAQTLREQEAALNTTVRGLAGGSQLHRRRPLASAFRSRASAHLAASRAVSGACGWQAGALYRPWTKAISFVLEVMPKEVGAKKK